MLQVSGSCNALFHLPLGHIGEGVATPTFFKQGFFIAVQVTDKVGEPQGVSRLSGGAAPFSSIKRCLASFPLGVDFILRGRDAFQIIGVMVFLFGVEVAVILNQLTQAFFQLSTSSKQGRVRWKCRHGQWRCPLPMYHSHDPPSRLENQCMPPRAVFPFQKINVLLFVFLLLELAVDAVFPIWQAVPFCEDGINVLL